MKIKNILLLFLFFITAGFTKGQVVNNLNRQAQRAFDQFAYDQARDLYLESFRRDSAQMEVVRGLANTYLKLNNSIEAEYWLQKLRGTDSLDSEDVNYALVQQLSKNGKYNKASEVLLNLRLGERERYRQQALEKLDEFRASANNYKIEHLFFNTEKSDFGPMYYLNGQLAFVASRRKSSWSVNRFNWDKSEFLDFYSVNLPDQNDSIREEPKGIKSLNSTYHEGPGQLFEENRRFVFTRNHLINNRLGRQDEGISKLQIYFAERSVDGDWEEVESFEKNIFNYSFGHPTITEKGDSLIFASDMPGGYGGTDLYISYRQATGWTVPKNLGAGVNTEGNELFPFLNKGKLYFASDTWPGLGGLDVFVTALESTHDPFNFGAPVNSSQDDFGLITMDDGQSGYFATDRLGNDDVFSFQAQFYTLKGRVLNQRSGELVAEATVKISGPNEESRLGNTEDGRFDLNLSDYGYFKVYAEHEGMLTNDTLELTIDQGFVGTKTIDLYLSEPYFTIEVIDAKSRTPLEEPVYYIKPIDSKKTLVPVQGDHNYRVEPNRVYEVFANAEGYFSKRDTVTIPPVLASMNHQVMLKKVVVGESIRLEHIYYDLNSAALRPESLIELDKLEKFMIDNPNLKIELGSHTDSRGSDAYNMKLSQKRAESATKYLISKGIRQERIIPKGYGESKPVNGCVNGIKCSENQYQDNRRTELIVISF